MANPDQISATSVETDIFFISDTHHAHTNILRYCDRPFANVDEMNQALIDNWNRVVCSSGTVYHIGDFAFGKLDYVKEVRAQLNGTIHLILGNHDRLRPRQYLEAGFASVQQSWRMKLSTKTVLLQHHPPAPNDKWPLGVQTILCGHIHNNPGWWESLPDGKRPRIYNCSVEQIGYRPVTYPQLMEIWSERFKKRDLERTHGVHPVQAPALRLDGLHR